MGYLQTICLQQLIMTFSFRYRLCETDEKDLLEENFTNIFVILTNKFNRKILYTSTDNGTHIFYFNE